ncbi:MAG: MarC family protein [Kiritimatiellae bacterium]|nr:MarC family protein [Kiritimatiellia bacterium]
MREFWFCFVPLFVAVDALGTLPLFIAMTEGLEPGRIRRVLFQSVVTAALVALAFVAIGRGVLTLLSITVADFMIAGGLLLFALSLSDLLTTLERSQRAVDLESVGAVPLGVPLIVGPAVLTTSILLVGNHGAILTGFALLANITLAGIIFSLAQPIHRLLGKPGSKVLSKLASILLASIAVMMVRKGIILSGSEIAAHVVR